MKHILQILSGIFLLTNSFAQTGTPKKPMLFLEPEIAQTLKDRTKQNNIRGVGLGLQLTLPSKSKFSTTFALSNDFVFLDDKVFRTNAGGSAMESITNVLKILAGADYTISEHFNVSFAAGPAFINGQTLAAIKPGIGFYLSDKKRFVARLAYSNIFNRDSGEKENYSALIFSLGLRLF